MVRGICGVGVEWLEDYIRFSWSMGGAFLSQPVTTKKVNKYQHGKLRVVTCEMQGRTAKIQDGVNTWRMHWSSIASTRRYSSLLSSTDTVVSRSHSSAPKTYLRY